MNTPSSNYELKYWRESLAENTPEKYLHYLKLWDIAKDSQLGDVLEMGAGPLYGCLPYLAAVSKALIDPLWDDYVREGMAKAQPAIKTVSAKIEDIDQTELAQVKYDLILCGNALDHADPGYLSVVKIAQHLKAEGVFCLHLHLRTLSQLNEGHDHLMSLSEIQAVLKQNGVRECWIADWPHDPIENCGYHTVIAKWQKESSNVTTE